MSSIANEYEALEVIGRGSFGTVRKVRQKSNGAILVRKEIEYTSMNIQEKNHIISELRILRELDHPHIVNYLRHDHILEKKAIHIYQEYCDGGDLGKVISTFKRNKEMVPEEFIWEVLVQTLLALYRCHYGMDCQPVNLFAAQSPESEPEVNSETVIIHRDIKPENIFLLGPKKTIKLGDFGLAKMLTSQNDFAKTYVGTPYYMSPEVLMDNPYSPVCDIWSLGCVLFELCNLQPPFQAKTHLQLQTKIRNGQIPEISSHYSQQLRTIIRESITVDAESRPTCHELLESISVKLFRKEMELKLLNDTLNSMQKQLMIKNQELKKRESKLKDIESREVSVKDLERRETLLANLQKREEFLHNFERKLQLQKQELDHQVNLKKKELEDDYISLQRKCAMHKEELENELIEDFEQRKRAMDQEGKEMRIFYQREFRHVVEQEVQLRISDILQKKASGEHMEELRRQKSTSSSSSSERPYRTQSPAKPKGPREFVEESNIPPTYTSYQQHPLQQTRPATGASFPIDGQQKRSPLKSRNQDFDFESIKIPAVRQGDATFKKRVTDEFGELNLQKRNIPEFEEQYRRMNIRH